MRLTPRRRVMVALLVSWPLALIWVGWIVLTVYSLLEYSRTTYTSCGGGTLTYFNLPGYFDGCGGLFSWPVAAVELIVLLAVAIGVAVAISRWVVGPVCAARRHRRANRPDQFGSAPAPCRPCRRDPASGGRRRCDARSGR